MDEIMQAITNHGFSVVLLAWMIYKDYKFNDCILKVMQEVKEVLSELRICYNAEEESK